MKLTRYIINTTPPTPQSEAFWVKNGFIKAGEVYTNDYSACLPMERLI